MKSLMSAMAEKITLGWIGYCLAGLTLFVTIMGTVVVLDYTSGRLNLDGTLSATQVR